MEIKVSIWGILSQLNPAHVPGVTIVSMQQIIPRYPKCASNDDDLLVLGVQDLWVGAILLGSPPASPFVGDVTAIQQRLGRS